MLYIHQLSCISPQRTFPAADINELVVSANNRILAIEPSYSGIPPGMLRRMGKAVRMGVGAALPLMQFKPDGIVIGTANGGMEDSIKFLNQIIDYNEGMLTPGNFVQSTTNAIAGQMGLMTANKGYNITHVHRALAFENALLDVSMLVKENPQCSYLIGAVDEISDYNYNIEYLGGWYKKESISNAALFAGQSPASIAGEGAAMFLVNGNKISGVAKIDAVTLIHSRDANYVAEALKHFIRAHGIPDILMTGENGDARLTEYFDACESVVGVSPSILRFKHMCGEYATASSFACWTACSILQNQQIPKHMIKHARSSGAVRSILIYNTYKGNQHSFILVSSTNN